MRKFLIYFSLFTLHFSLLFFIFATKSKDMKEFIKEAKVETAVIVGLITPQQNERKTTEYLNELEFLAETAGAKVVRRFTQRVNGPSSITYIGSGKLEEIADFIKQKDDEEDPDLIDVYSGVDEYEEEEGPEEEKKPAKVSGIDKKNKKNGKKR